MEHQPIQDLGPATVENYRRSRRIARRVQRLSKDKAERKVIGEMVSECEYVIEWLQSGKRPGNKRGIERRAAYQREKLMDPLRMQAFVRDSKAGSPANLTDWQRFQIEDALSRLSPRERECYVLSHGECFSFREIALMLNITKSGVQEYVERAQKKISDDLANSLFLRE